LVRVARRVWWKHLIFGSKVKKKTFFIWLVNPRSLFSKYLKDLSNTVKLYTFFFFFKNFLFSFKKRKQKKKKKKKNKKLQYRKLRINQKSQLSKKENVYNIYIISLFVHFLCIF
jgi:hypothetical protein